MDEGKNTKVVCSRSYLFRSHSYDFGVTELQIEKRKKRSQILNVKLFMGLRGVEYRQCRI